VIDIRSWLEQFGLQKYGSVFEEHEITVDLLPDLTESDIDRLALPIGPRRRLMIAIQTLRAAQAQPSAQTSETSIALPTLARQPERRQLTVMFCDLVGSTALASRLDDAEELRELLRAYRTACRDVIERYEGSVAQYLGDGLMVYFGWPRAHEDDAERCLRAALDVVQAVKCVSAEIRLAVRIGVATGTVVIGEGSGTADETQLAVGETPGLATRLHERAKPDEIVIAHTTRRLVGDAFDLTDLNVWPLDGIEQPVRAWRVDALRRTDGRFDAAHQGRALTPLVGREEEVSLLMRAWRQARDGEGRVVVIRGEPGIGKSRLIQVLREEIAGEPFTGLRYQCSLYHLNSTLSPFIEQVEFATGWTGQDTVAEKLDKMEAMLAGSPAQIAEAAPLFAAMLSLPGERYPPVDLSPRRQKEKTLEVLADQVEALSRRQPVLMVFEDVHWIDPTSQEALDVLMPRLQALPVLLVITHRPEYAPHWREHAHVTTLGLGRLSRRHGADLVARMTQDKTLPAEVLEQIVAHTDGVPLFVEELTKSVLESGLLREEGDRYTLVAPLPPVAIPTSLRDSLLARLDRLAPVKDILQIGACIGREFSYRLLARISALDHDRLEQGLRTLAEAGLISRRGTPPEATYTFKHALMQEAAYDFLLKSRRAQLHAQIARVLEEGFTDRAPSTPERLAHHYTESGNLTAAIPLWQKAGVLAVRKFALLDAVAHLQRGLALIEQSSRSAERDRVELSIRAPLNTAWMGLRGWSAPEVAANHSAILELARRLYEPQSLLLGLWGMWSNTITQGRIADSLHWAERLLAEGNEAQNRDMQIFGHTNVTISRFYLGHLLDSREQSKKALEMYDPAQAGRWMESTSLDLLTFVGAWSSQWTWMLGYPEQAVRMSEERDEYARRLGNPFNLGFVLTLGAYVFDYRREPQRLLERVREAGRLAREQSIPFLSDVQIPMAEGLAQLRSGQLSEAIVSLRRGVDNWNAVGGHIRIPYVKAALAEALALQGNLDSALQTVDECLDQIGRPGWEERSHLAEVLRLKGWMLMRRNQLEEAETALREAIAWARQQQARSWELRASTTLAELLLQRGQRDGAREAIAPIYNWFTEGFDTHDLVTARRLLDSLE
jgi:class 3 adenylate cyclase/tetratricopeptide (TPR) repeat protein